MTLDLPNAFASKYQALLGTESPAFLASFQHAVQKGFRLNPEKRTRVLPLVDTKAPIDYLNDGYYGSVAGQSIAHISGGVYSQEPSAMYVGAVVAPEPGEAVLDLCAAPGGKSTHIGGQMQGTGLLIANEINYKRAKVLSENVERMGLSNTVVTNERPDALAAVWPEAFDRILVDAPCSGEGMFRKDPAAMNYWTPDYPAECAHRQKKILTSALAMLKPGGTLVYSTCTFAPEEDEQNCAWLLETFPEMVMLPIQKFPGMDSGRPEWANDAPVLKNAVRLWPHHIQGEGHFIAKFQKKGASSSAAPRKKRRPAKTAGLTKTQQALVNEFSQNTFAKPVLMANRLEVHGAFLHQVPAQTLPLAGLTVLRNGLHVGVFKKQRFEPDHALATALNPVDFRVQTDLNEADFRAYRHGEVLSLAQPLQAGKAFGLLTYQGLGFGMGNFVQKQIKNFYPKGLRV